MANGGNKVHPRGGTLGALATTYSTYKGNTRHRINT